MADDKTFKDGTGTSYVHALQDISSVFYTKIVGAAAENAAAAGNPLLAAGRYDSSPRTLDDGDAGAVALDSDGHVLVKSSSIVSAIQDVETAVASLESTVTAGQIDQATPYKNVDVDESEDQIKGTAGVLYAVHCINVGTSARYLKFYNATAANVTVGTTTPVLTLAIPTTGDTNGAGFTWAIAGGIAFDTAITVAATTGVADSDTGAPGANEVILSVAYA